MYFGTVPHWSCMLVRSHATCHVISDVLGAIGELRLERESHMRGVTVGDEASRPRLSLTELEEVWLLRFNKVPKRTRASCSYSPARRRTASTHPQH